LYGESWPKFEYVTKKVLNPRTSELLAFDGKSTFDFFLLYFRYKASLALYAEIKPKKNNNKSGLFIEILEFQRPLFCAAHTYRIRPSGANPCHTCMQPSLDRVRASLRNIFWDSETAEDGYGTA
jgi:hypothetical protein